MRIVIPTGILAFITIGKGSVESVNLIGNDLAEASAKVSVTGMNEAPVAVDDAFTILEGEILQGMNLLDNDTDPDGDALQITSVGGNPVGPTVTSVTVQGVGSISVAPNGDFTFDQNGNFENLQVGEESTAFFDYTVSDGNGAEASATVSVTVTGMNDAPIAVDDEFTISEGEILQGKNLLDNDVDPDGDALQITSVHGSPVGPTVTSVTVQGVGSISVAPNGDFTFDQNGNFEDLQVGEESTAFSFEYTVSDGNGAEAFATVSVTVTSSASAAPSKAPSNAPSKSAMPSQQPSATASAAPSKAPSHAPSKSAMPSQQPSATASAAPSKAPSNAPSKSAMPSQQPSATDSAAPSKAPSNAPSKSAMPSQQPAALTSFPECYWNDTPVLRLFAKLVCFILDLFNRIFAIF